MSSKKVFGRPDQDLEVRLVVGRQAGVKRGLTVWTERGLRRQGSWVRKARLRPRPLSQAPPTAARWEGGSHIALSACCSRNLGIQIFT